MDFGWKEDAVTCCWPTKHSTDKHPKKEGGSGLGASNISKILFVLEGHSQRAAARAVSSGPLPYPTLPSQARRRGNMCACLHAFICSRSGSRCLEIHCIMRRELSSPHTPPARR